MPRPPSKAQMFFENLKEQGAEDRFEFLSQIPLRYETDPFFEEEWIDFKQYPKRDPGHLPVLWSEALSAFANSGGGVLVWGIKANKKSPGGIDAAHEVALINDPFALCADLKKYCLNANTPPVPGIDFLPCPGPDTKGFLVCYIPESNYKPHRADLAGKQYFIRVNDSSVVPDLHVLRLLFHPQSQARLEITTEMQCRIDNPSSLPGHNIFKIKVIGNIQNTGNATAKDVFVRINFSGGSTIRDEVLYFHPISSYSNHINDSLADRSFIISQAIHPGQSIQFFSSSECQLDSSASNPRFDKLSINYTIFAENYKSQQIFVEFAENEFANLRRGDPKIISRNGQMRPFLEIG